MAANSDRSASISRRGPGKPFARGVSGNPSGRPKIISEIRDLAQQHGPAAIAALAEMAGLTPGVQAEAEAARIAAIREILDRGYGKATQPLSGDPDGPPLAIEFVWANALSQPAEQEAIEDAANGFVVTFATEAS